MMACSAFKIMENWSPGDDEIFALDSSVEADPRTRSPVVRLANVSLKVEPVSKFPNMKSGQVGSGNC